MKPYTDWIWRELAPGIGLQKRTFMEGFARVAVPPQPGHRWGWGLYRTGSETPLAWGLASTEGQARKAATEAAKRRGWL